MKKEFQKQPFLLCVATDVFKSGKLYAVVDGEMIPVGTDFVHAFDVLYKIHHVYNLKYEAALSKFYNFFDAFIYKIKGVNPLGASSNFFKKIHK